MKKYIKNGFTLVELLAVIVLLALLAVLVVPNIVNVRQNINKKISKEKIDYLESAAELYGTNNPDFFVGSDEKVITVQSLLNENYIEADTKYKSGNCKKDEYKDTGCVTNDKGEILNDTPILLTKKVAGVVAKLNASDSKTVQGTLVQQVCAGFGKNYYGKTLDGKYCGCGEKDENDRYDETIYEYKIINDVYTKTDTKITGSNDDCILVSNKDNGDINNWLQYGSPDPNWRVLGLYKMEDGNLSAKIITNEPID